MDIKDYSNTGYATTWQSVGEISETMTERQCARAFLRFVTRMETIEATGMTGDPVELGAMKTALMYSIGVEPGQG